MILSVEARDPESAREQNGRQRQPIAYSLRQSTCLHAPAIPQDGDTYEVGVPGHVKVSARRLEAVMHRIAIAALFSVALSCAALAQINTDTCQLTVRVRTIQDREYSRPLQVELLSNGGTPISAAQTNGTGNADFQVRSGWYLSDTGLRPGYRDDNCRIQNCQMVNRFIWKP